MSGLHRVHTLFSGSSIITIEGVCDLLNINSICFNNLLNNILYPAYTYRDRKEPHQTREVRVFRLLQTMALWRMY